MAPLARRLGTTMDVVAHRSLRMGMARGAMLGMARADPGVPHEVHRLAASLVAMAVLAPVLLVPRRHVEIDRAPDRRIARRRDDDRLRVDHGRPCIADDDAA